MRSKFIWLVLGVLIAGGCSPLPTDSPKKDPIPAADPPADPPQAKGPQKATFGGGCFWCTEAVFQQLKGVRSVVSGYSGGSEKNPTYQQVCSGSTGHAEVIQITFDPKVIPFDELLRAFWQTHDPTTLNRQGPDVGTQYRSVIFYHNKEQKALAQRYKKKLDSSGAFDRPIVTAIEPFSAFYPAEKYHQNFFRNNPEHGYCKAFIPPKLAKLEKVFKDRLKSPR
jgi:peptide-methionine (S)-S-oxide reductase